MHYYSVEEARDKPGIRLVLSQGSPGPFGEAVKAIFKIKGIDYIPVAQNIGEDNEELFAWTGRRNAPIVIVDNEKPVDRWLDIIMLAERLAPTPSLLPSDSELRAQVVGVCNEIAGEWGFGWARRAFFMGRDTSDATRRLRSDYAATTDAADRAPARIADVLTMLTNRLKAQKARGSDYLIGDSLTAADIYWALFSIGIKPFPLDVSPMPEYLIPLYETVTPEIAAAMDPILFEHRDTICKEHVGLPLKF